MAVIAFTHFVVVTKVALIQMMRVVFFVVLRQINVVLYDILRLLNAFTERFGLKKVFVHRVWLI